MTLDEYEAAYAWRVRRVVWRFMVTRRRACAADLDDIMQTVRIKVWTALEGGWQPDERGPMKWLSAVGCNAAVDLWRRRASPRKPRIVGSADEYPDLPDPAPGPADAVEASVLGLAVRDALGRLVPIQRDALTMIYLDGLTYEAAAARTGIPAATIKTRAHRGRANLAPMLAAWA